MIDPLLAAYVLIAICLFVAVIAESLPYGEELRTFGVALAVAALWPVFFSLFVLIAVFVWLADSWRSFWRRRVRP